MSPAGEQKPSTRDHEACVTVPTLSIIGLSDSGKTTLLTRLLPELKRLEIRTAVIKHSSHTHPLHKPGSDSDKLEKAGAIASGFATPQGLTLHFPGELETMLERVQASVSGAVDLLLVEGWKDGPVPKVEVYRKELGEPLSSGRSDVIAVVTRDEPPVGMLRFDPENARLLAEFIGGWVRDRASKR
jgi:molybdopterin-guanine dinucleotide biosynthesis protein MobB